MCTCSDRIQLWHNSFGQKCCSPGFEAADGSRHVFPICIGETGTRCLATEDSQEVMVKHLLDAESASPGQLSIILHFALAEDLW